LFHAIPSVKLDCLQPGHLGKNVGQEFARKGFIEAFGSAKTVQVAGTGIQLDENVEFFGVDTVVEAKGRVDNPTSGGFIEARAEP